MAKSTKNNKVTDLFSSDEDQSDDFFSNSEDVDIFSDEDEFEDEDEDEDIFEDFDEDDEDFDNKAMTNLNKLMGIVGGEKVDTPKAFPGVAPVVTLKTPIPGKVGLPQPVKPTLTQPPQPPKATLAQPVKGILPQPVKTLTPKLPEPKPALRLSVMPQNKAGPNIPNIKPIQQTTPVPTPVIAAKRTEEVEEILKKMSGISLSPVPVSDQPADINDLLQKETDETPEDFESRKKLTIMLASIPDYPINNATAMVAAQMMMKKAKLNLTYEPDIEDTLSYLTLLLQRK